ncbi:amidase family protein [Aquibacillus sp. 3ASR75-11]|uniref:Amidase family protein n=2 Tax=Terrihalobacillus insolitus TaxID=2950438 RepID=A0A9X4ALI9_9BACI|nr:amidase family protein [Terrihalobacillus insolitus]MDC3423819.1 amidase family protein [Terrihalobacillus insolitus]
MQKAMEANQTTSLELTKNYLERIAKYDKSGPSINAISEINPDALHIAEALDAERVTKGVRGLLHGIPILLKDNIDTGDHMHTSAGSVALENHFAEADSFVAKKLREAGAVLLGKANLTEWANFMTEGMPNGYSSRGGQVLNPYGPGKFDVGGSSSGPGAAVASGFAAGAIGTETSGSILSPASSNSIVGIKPTVGLISRTGIIPIAHSQDTAGPMTLTVTDAAILLGVLTGVDDKDPATAIRIEKADKDYTKNLNKDGLKGARIGVDRNYLSDIDSEDLALIDQALKEMTRLGAVIVDPTEIPVKMQGSSVLFHEFKKDVNAYLAKVSANVPVHSLKDVIKYNEKHAGQALKYGQTLLTASEEKNGTLTEPEYIIDRLNDLRLSQTEGIDAVMEEHKLDALLFCNNYGAGIAAKAGYPSITVPAGYTASNGKPVGVTFTGKAFTEPKLIELAYAYEQGTKHRKAPVLD